MIRRKPVPAQSQPQPVAAGAGATTEESQQLSVLTDEQGLDAGPPDAVPRKALSRTSTTYEQLLRGPPDLTFVWGVKTQAAIASEFFFFMSNRRITSCTPPLSLRNLAKEVNPTRIKRVLAAAVGPESDCYAAWTTSEDECRWILRRSPQPPRLEKNARRKWISSRPGISALESWLLLNLTNPFSIITARVVFGPEGSFFASYLRAPTETREAERVATWHHLPDSLQELLKRRALIRGRAESIPAIVALGVNKAWVAVWPDKEASWDLAGTYDALARLLEAKDGSGVENVYLSANEPDQYYVQYVDRTAYLSAPILHTDLELLNACLISSLLNNSSTSASPTNKSPRNSPPPLSPSRTPPPGLSRTTTNRSISQMLSNDPVIIPSPPPGILNVSVISDRDFHSPFVSLPTIPPIPRSKLKFVHFAKAPEAVKNSWSDSTENVTANMTRAAGCPVM